MTGVALLAGSIRTTDGAIALSNLEAQIDGLEQQVAGGERASRCWADLIDLISLRAQILGRVADYERASSLAERWSDAAPDDGCALLSRARTRANLHRFEEAMNDLDLAVKLGLSGREVEAEKAAILQAIGRYDEAMTIRRRTAESIFDFGSAAGLASLYAEIGNIENAEWWFDESCRRYRSVSPFAMAQLEFQRGHMWLRHSELKRAHDWFLAAWRRLPAYAEAEGHLAEAEAASGEYETAIARLRRLASVSDDPDYASQLAGILDQAGRLEEVRLWRAKAVTRYGELLARHPAAFADHAAEFWLAVGDSQRALAAARQNFEVRRTPRAHELLSRAIVASEMDRPVDYPSCCRA